MLQDTLKAATLAARDTVTDTADAVARSHHLLAWLGAAIIAAVVVTACLAWFVRRQTTIDVPTDSKRR